MKIHANDCIFVKVAGTQPASLSKNWTLVQVYFKWLVYLLGALPSKQTSKKKAAILKYNVYYVTKGISLFIFSDYSLYV